MDRKTLDRVWLERLERIESNLDYCISTATSKEQEKLLKRDALMMKEGINDLYYALLDNM